MNPLILIVDYIGKSLNLIIENIAIVAPLVIYTMIELTRHKEGKEFVAVIIYEKIKSKINSYKK